MDKRIIKTKTALYDAFFQLRRKKSVHEIKIAELCQLAGINKTTFYAHYKSIYDLSEVVERQFLYKILSSIPDDKDYSLENPQLFTREVTLALERHADELSVLFSGGELTRLSVYLDQAVKSLIFSKFPQLRDNGEMNVLLSYCIHGAFGTRISNPDVPLETRMKVLEAITAALTPVMEE